MLQEFRDVFLDEILGLPPKRDIDFTIELVSREAPMSKIPYRMSTPKMLELKIQLQELLEKKYISPSMSPWGAPVLFVKKKDGLARNFVAPYADRICSSGLNGLDPEQMVHNKVGRLSGVTGIQGCVS